jgi:hypothetical protein
MPLKTYALGLALVLGVAGAPVVALAQTTHPVHPVYTNARFQIGGGLPIPISLTPPGGILPIGGTPSPNGRARLPGCGGVAAAAVTFNCNTTATVMQGTGAVPSIMLAPGFLTHPGSFMNVPVFLANSMVFQVATSFMLVIPPTAVATPMSLTFQANGRTGPSTVTWCVGLPIPTGTMSTGYNPACTGPGVGTPIGGLAKYTKTANQFGGAGTGPNAIASGIANVALVNAFATPCTTAGSPNGMCLVAFANASGVSPGAIGAAFGVTGVSTPTTPSPGLFAVGVDFFGNITTRTTTGLGAGSTNQATSFAVPWTTGMLTVQMTGVFGGPPETFIRTGSDGRVSGVGGISLVGGALSNRATSGPNANRGWINIYVPEPGAVLGATAALLMLVTCHRLTRRNR